jgi:choline dehydrogenase-like flavoprotein
MLLDARTFDEKKDFPRVPVVIIGAGTVGLFMAVQLAKAKIPTIVVETGSHVADTRRSGQTALSLGKPHAGVTLGRAFGLGGTSTLWAGQLAEFDEMDLSAPGKEWPLQYSELRRWYQHVYASLNIKPVPSPADVAVNQPEAEDGIERFVTSWLPRQNFAFRFRADIKSIPNLTVILNATVNRVTFDGPTAVAVHARTPTGLEITLLARCFVFACGTLETSRFFLSAQRVSSVPWKYNTRVGAYFQDHLIGSVANVRVSDEKKFRDYFEHGFSGGTKFTPKLRNSRDFKRGWCSGVVGSFAFPSQIQKNFDDLKTLIRTFTSSLSFSRMKTVAVDVYALGHALIPLAIRFARHRRIMVFLDRGTELVIQAEQIPTQASAIRLMDEGPQQDGLVRAAVHWSLDGGEIHNIRNFVERVDKYLERQKIARLEIDERLVRCDPSILSEFGDYYHQAGGMCIGGSASSGVTDSDCRVWDTANVFVAGASVFPTSSHANITLTALALAARLAHRLENSELRR